MGSDDDVESWRLRRDARRLNKSEQTRFEKSLFNTDWMASRMQNNKMKAALKALPRGSVLVSLSVKSTSNVATNTTER